MKKRIRTSDIFFYPEAFHKIEWRQCSELRTYYKARGITNVDEKIKEGYTLIRAARNFVKDDPSYFFSVLVRMVVFLYPDKYRHPKNT